MGKEMKLPTGWESITLRQFSDYNKVCVKYGEDIKLWAILRVGSIRILR